MAEKKSYKFFPNWRLVQNQWKSLKSALFFSPPRGHNLYTQNTTKWWCNTTISSTIAHPQPQKDKQAPLSRPAQCFHGCRTALSLISRLHSTEHCCHALHSRPRSPLPSARERKRRERGGEIEGGREGEREWEGGRRENLAFTVRSQRYIMGGQTILLHAVFFLTNRYMTKQYVHILYKSEAACQALITVALAARRNRGEKEIRDTKRFMFLI